MNFPIFYRSLASITCLTGIFAFACSADVGDTASEEHGESDSQDEAVVAQSNGFAHVNSSGVLLKSYSSLGATVSSSKVAATTGQYVVEFVNFPSNSNVQVVSTSGSARCSLANQALVGAVPPSAVRLSVHCNRGSNGTFQDAAFIVQIANGTATSSSTDGAYLLTSVATPPAGSSSISHIFGYNSASSTNSVTWSSTGKYVVSLRGMTEANPNLHVTAYGTEGTGKYCKIKNWSRVTDPLAMATVNVNCYDAAGSAANSRFSIAYRGTKLAPTFGWGLVNGIVLVSAKWSTACPGAPSNATELLFPTTSTEPEVIMHDAGQATKGVPMVTASGDSNVYCNVSGGWVAGANTYDVKLRPRCFSPGGAPTSPAFQFLYSSSSLIPPC